MVHVNGLIDLIMLALRVVSIGAAAFAIFHAVRQRKDAFTAVDKLTKPFWLGILVVALLLLMVPLGPLFWIIAIVAVCVYLVDVRPRVDDIQRGPRW